MSRFWNRALGRPSGRRLVHFLCLSLFLAARVSADVVTNLGVLAVRTDNNERPRGDGMPATSGADAAIRSLPVWNPGLLAMAAAAASAGGFAFWTLRSRRRLRSEQELRRRIERESAMERRYTNLTEHAGDLIATLDARGAIVTLNPAGRTLLGLERPAGVSLAGLLHTADRASFEKAVRSALGGDPVPVFELRLARSGGETAHIEVSASACVPESGPPEVQCIARDVTSRKRIEAAAREAIQRQRVHVENTPLGVIEWNARFEVVAWNPAAERIFGWTALEALGRTAEFITPLPRRRVLDRMWSAVTAGPTGREETTENLTNGGRLIQCLWHHTPLLSPEGSVAGVASLVQDVTQQRATAARLAESEERQRLVLSALAEAVLVVDAVGVVRSANFAAERITGFPAAEMPGLRILEWVAGFVDDQGRPMAWAENPLAKALLSGEVQRAWSIGILRADGRTAWLSGHVTPFPESSRGWAGSRVVSFADVTSERESRQRREQLEAQLRQSQKMESLGTLAGGVAHDFNNVLAMILGNAELLAQDTRDGERGRRIEDIAVAARRGAEVVARILAFSRPQPATMTHVRLSEIVRDVLRLLRAGISKDIVVEAAVSPDEPTISGDAGQLRQLLLNLVTNAAHAMEKDGGRLEIRVEPARTGAAEEFASGGISPGAAARLSVIDTGPGMVSEVKRRLFEPFFTTKAPGKGTGLGLAVVHGILLAHGGAAKVFSEPGRGTRFEVFFPAVDDPAPERVEEPSAPPSRGRGERVLLVDDEPGVMDFSRTALTRLGYRVTAFVDPAQAMEAFRSGPDGVELVLTDLSMPGMSGAELACEVHALRPGLPVVLASGYAAGGDFRHEPAARFAATLAKPFDIAELGRIVREVLDRSGALGDAGGARNPEPASALSSTRTPWGR